MPAVEVGEHAAEQHADRAAAGADEAVDAHRLGALVRLGEEVHQQRERDRLDDRAADALHRARDHQRHLRRRDAAGQRRQREERDADDEQAALAVQVAEPAAEQQEAAAGEHVGVDDPDQRRLAEAEVGADRRQRDVDDGDVEHDHQHAEADDAERDPAARQGDRVGRMRPGRAPHARSPMLVVWRADESTGHRAFVGRRYGGVCGQSAAVPFAKRHSTAAGLSLIVPSIRASSSSPSRQ